MNSDIMWKSWTINDDDDDDDWWLCQIIYSSNIITWFINSGIGPTRNSTVTLYIHIVHININTIMRCYVWWDDCPLYDYNI
jgi:hypothetical protein